MNKRSAPASNSKADTTNSRSALANALRFARLGMPIVLLKPKEKVPALSGGVNKATTDFDEIRRLFSERPGSNYAAWRDDYNDNRPHSRLGWQTPSAFAQTFPRRDLALRKLIGSAPAPDAPIAHTGKPNSQGELRTG